MARILSGATFRCSLCERPLEVSVTNEELALATSSMFPQGKVLNLEQLLAKKASGVSIEHLSAAHISHAHAGQPASGPVLEIAHLADVLTELAGLQHLTGGGVEVWRLLERRKQELAAELRASKLLEGV